ncbi:hypothetical protein AB1Y20_012824 [Prymnesium parvum]|uniref:HAT C-terminal dimerisation domain-containing protein n=1 Tax=Prymnesium parvum TaxID=97485 RepID=A0AB34IIZ1_PRYPA
MLEVKGLPPSLKLADRERPLEQKRPAQLSSMIDLARAILSDEIETRCFLQRSSNARMVQLYMSKQMDAKDILSPEHREREHDQSQGHEIQLWCKAVPWRSSLPRRRCGGGDTSTQNLGDAHDEAISEVDSWARLPSEAYADFFDDKTGLLNEFAMMWRFRHKFPIHFIVFKQTACHLPHEAFVEQVFSTAGFLSEQTQLDPEYLANLVMISRNKDAFKPTCDQVKEKYYQLFRGKGGEGMDVECV